MPDAGDHPAASDAAVALASGARLAPAAARARFAARRDRMSRWAMPLAIGPVAIGCREPGVRIHQIPHYILPASSRIAASLWHDWTTLWPSQVITLQVTFMALGVAVAGGVGLAVLFTLSPWVERSFYPYAIVQQVTPVVMIAPLLMVAATGIVVFVATSTMAHLILRIRHESAIRKENCR